MTKPTGPKPIQMEAAQKTLDELTGGSYSIIEWNHPSKCVFFDKARNRTFEYFFTELKKGFKKNPNWIPSPASEDLQKAKLASLTNNYTLLEYKKLPHKSVFKDNRTGRIVEYRFDRMISGLQQTDTFIADPTPEERKQIRQVQFAKSVETNLQKYGCANPFGNKDIQEKIKNTLSANYEGGHPRRDPKILSKTRATRVANGTMTVIDGKTLLDLAHEKGVGLVTLHRTLHEVGEQGVKDYDKKFTNIERVVLNILDNLGVTSTHNKTIDTSSTSRPDFQVNGTNLVIECDGLYWHSDLFKDSEHHKNRRAEFIEAGYRPLFFREDEILTKSHVVESIIRNALGLNTVKVFARKCKVEETKDTSFLNNNHLMGKGSGRIFSLVHEGNVVAQLQVKWISKEEKILDISRFCCAPSTTVVGGFTKLLRHVENEYNPNIIQTFIDLRYGSGEYLGDLGFCKMSTHVSFKWTNFNETFGRMCHPSNTGYDKGLRKLWDCGQAKWVKQINNPTKSA